jgi:hypothetical protein
MTDTAHQAKDGSWHEGLPWTCEDCLKAREEKR